MIWLNRIELVRGLRSHEYFQRACDLLREFHVLRSEERQLQFQLEDLEVSRNYRVNPWALLSLTCCSLYGTTIRNHNSVIK